MFKKEIYSLLLFSFGLLFTCCGESATDDEEKDNNGQGSVSVETNYLPIADPYVMFYNNKYYAYGTGGTTAGEGFACFSSDDLKNWKREGQALSATDSYGTWGFWAPEVYYVESKKKFYLFYSAEEHICLECILSNLDSSISIQYLLSNIISQFSSDGLISSR